MKAQTRMDAWMVLALLRAMVKRHNPEDNGMPVLSDVLLDATEGAMEEEGVVFDTALDALVTFRPDDDLHYHDKGARLEQIDRAMAWLEASR